MSTPRIHNGFGASERLQLRKQIETLFRFGEAFSVFPIRVIYQLIPLPPGTQSPVRTGFSIPKKRVKLAVGRNRIRRVLKEAWRLNKHHLYGAVPPGKQLHVFLVFIGKEAPSFEQSVERIKNINNQLINQLNAVTGS